VSNANSRGEMQSSKEKSQYTNSITIAMMSSISEQQCDFRATM
jgi:head-tail adaptor